MSRVLCVSFSIEGNYILSGSEDGNLRIWKKPDSLLDSKFHEKAKKKKISSHRFHEKNFLPKLVFNIKKIKMKLNDLNRLKKFRFMENTIPGNISTKTGFKRPIIDLQI